jgi:hypothetical protein
VILLRSVIKGIPDAGLAAAAAPDVATAGTALLAKCGVGTVGVLTGVLNGTGVIAGGLLALSFFVVSRCIAAKDQKRADEQMASFAASLKHVESQLDALGKQNDHSQIVEVLRQVVDTAELPNELKRDANVLIGELFAHKIIDRIDELDEKLANALGDAGSRQAMVLVYNTDQLNESARREVTQRLQGTIQSEEGLFERLGRIEAQDLPQVFIPFPELRSNRGEVNASRFVFSERLTPVLNGEARKQDLADLQGFLDDERPLSWWFWHGNGGEGKSRLALELLLGNLGTWRGGFLRAGTSGTDQLFPNMGAWKPYHDTLFIVDYTAAYGPNLGHVITQLKDQISHFNGHRVRILLFERYHLEGVSWYRPIVNAAKRELNLMYAPARKISSLEIEELVDVFNQAYTQFQPAGQIPSAEARSFFAQNARNPQTARRNVPLYAALYALAISSGQSIANAEALDEYALQHEAEIWERHLHLNSCDVNAIMYSTMNRGMTLGELTELRTAPALGIENPSIDRMGRAIPVPAGSPYQFGAVEPDILGELFVAKRMKGELTVGGGDAAIVSWANALVAHHASKAYATPGGTP